MSFVRRCWLHCGACLDGVDLIRFKKMPLNVGGKPNPLALLGRTGSSSLNGNLVEMGDDLDAYNASIKKMQMPRYWRVFNRHPGAAFRVITDLDEALALLDTMDAQQGDRMERLGLKFFLSDDCCGRFYRDLAARGLEAGYVVISALMCDEGVIATTLGIRQGADYVLLRTSNAGIKWSSCSPGLLTIDRTMAALAQARRPTVRLQHRQLQLQAPVWRRARSTHGCEHRAQLAGASFHDARSRRAMVATLSPAGQSGTARLRECQVDRPHRRRARVRSRSSDAGRSRSNARLAAFPLLMLDPSSGIASMLFTPSLHAPLRMVGGVGGGGSAAITHAAVRVDRPPTPDPSPPLRGGRGEEKCAGLCEMESALRRIAPADQDGISRTTPGLPGAHSSASRSHFAALAAAS